MSVERLVIERLGNRGEGVALLGERRVFIPYALAGETVTAEVDGEHARLVDIVEASPQRIAPICPHFEDCGGCAVQTLRADAYADVEAQPRRNGARKCGADARRRADRRRAWRRPAARDVSRAIRRRQGAGRLYGGALASTSSRSRPVHCSRPNLPARCPPPARSRAILAPRGKPLDIAVTATLGGLDVELRGGGPLDETETGALLAAADAHDLARLTNHGKLVALRRAPQIKIGEATLTLPPGAFLQATQAGEETLAARVLSATAKAQNVADLFCGVGAFALRLARRAQVKAYDMDAGALAAMRAAAHATPGLRTLEGVARDLFTRPLSASELNGFDAVVFDPPRAGAAAQAAEIARSEVPIVVAVSCHAQSFARDAAILLKGGYVIREITPHRSVPLCGACRDRGRF